MYSFNKNDLLVVTLDSIFDRVNQQICDDIYIKYNMERFNQDAKRLLLHYLLKECCEVFIVLKSRGNNHILFVQPSFADKQYELFDRFDKVEVVQFILKSFKKLRNKVPFPVYVQNQSVDLTQNISGELIELINKLSRVVNTHLFKEPNLKDIKKFTAENGLKYLSRDYFTSLNAKRIYY